jgi:hypothetical protein
MTKKEIRNKPVKAITSFFPTDEVKNSDHFISNKRGEQFCCKNSIGRPNNDKNFEINEVDTVHEKAH